MELGIKLPYDPANLLLGTYHRKTIIQKDTWTPMFTAALFTTARTQKQYRRPLTEEQIKKLGVHIYNGILHSHKQDKNWVIFVL